MGGPTQRDRLLQQGAGADRAHVQRGPRRVRRGKTAKRGLSQNRFSPKYIQKKVPETCKSSKFPEIFNGFIWVKSILRQPLFLGLYEGRWQGLATSLG